MFIQIKKRGKTTMYTGEYEALEFSIDYEKFNQELEAELNQSDSEDYADQEYQAYQQYQKQLSYYEHEKTFDRSIYEYAEEHFKDEIVKELFFNTIDQAIDQFFYEVDEGRFYDLRGFHVTKLTNDIFNNAIDEIIKSNRKYKEIISKDESKTNTQLKQITRKTKDYIVSHYSYRLRSFSLEMGIPFLNTVKRYIRRESTKELIVLQRDEKYFDFPLRNDIPEPAETNIENIVNSKAWQRIGSIFTEECREYAIRGLILFHINCVLSYHGLERETPIFIVVSGKQGIGKDRFLFERLTDWIPNSFRLHRADASFITDEKNYEGLSKQIVALFPEMEKFSIADKNNIKSFITTIEFSYRKLISHNRLKLKNLVNLFGTTNETELSDIFRDTTGERRFLFLKTNENITSDDMEEILSKETVQEALSMIDSLNILTYPLYQSIRGYMESTRAKSLTELFFEDWKNTINNEVKSIKTQALFQKALIYLNSNGYTEHKLNERNFGKQIRPLMEQYGFKYDSNNSKYIKQ